MSSSILKYGQVIKIRSYQSSNTILTSKSYTDQNLYFHIYNKEKTFPSGGQDIININNYRESLFEVLPTSSFEINDEMNSQKLQSKKAESAPRAKTQEEQFKAIISEKRGKVISFGDKVIFRHVDSHYYMYGSFDCASSGIGAFKIQLKKELSEKIIFRLQSYRTYEKDGDQMSIYAPFKIYHSATQCYISYCFEKLFLDSGYQSNAISNPLRNFDKDFPVQPPKLKQFYYEGPDEQIADLQENNALSRVKQNLPKTGRYLIINENIHKRTFKLVTHNEFEMKVNKQKIRNHDIVYFIHTEKDQYICPNNFTSQVFLKKRLDQSDLTDIFDGLWEIEEIKTFQDKPNDDINLNKSKSPSRKVQFNQSIRKGQNIGAFFATLGPGNNLGQSFLAATVGNSLFEQEGDVQKKKEKKEKYILRHLSSGRILYVSLDTSRVELEHFQGQEKKVLLLESVDAKLEDGSLVQFTYKTRSNQSGKFIKKFLAAASNDKKNKPSSQNLKAGIQEQSEEVSAQIESQAEQSGNPIQNAYNSRFEKSKLQLRDESSQHGFRIYKISEQIKQLCLFVISSQEIISKFTYLIEQYRSISDLLNQLNVALLNNVINVLKNLIGFIYDCEYNKIAESGNNPNEKKQRIFDQLGMIELLTRLLEQIHLADFPPNDRQIPFFKNLEAPKQKLKKLEDLNKYSEYRKIRQVYEIGYKLLQSIAANNYLMKIKISKYMNKYLFHILQKANRTVYRSIQEFLDGNYLALEEIKEDYIEKLINSFDQNDPDPADLYFLSRLCLCKERTVPKNQSAIFTNFYHRDIQDIVQMVVGKSKFNMQQKLPPNKFKFREDQLKMQIFSCITPTVEPQYRTLSQLYQECILMKSEGGYDKDKNHWSYFMQYLNLMADICVRRNERPRDYIQKNLPLKTLVAFLHESTVKINLLFQPFIRLVHHAFVQTSDYQEINRITKVKEWNQLGNFKIPKAKHAIPLDIKKTMSLIFDYIRRINKAQVVDLSLPPPPPPLSQNATQQIPVPVQPKTIYIDVDDRDRLINIKTFLQILKSTLNLGFWPEIEQMKKMVPFLLKIMRFDIQYARKVLKQKKQADKKRNQNQHLTERQYEELIYGQIKQQVKLNKPNIVLLVQCKILAARIINIIIDYEYNVRVSIITKYFKDVMQMDADLSKFNYDKLKFIKTWKTHIEYDQFAPNNQKEGYLLIEQLWKEKVSQILLQRNIFSECVEENINFSLVFFESFIYSNHELTNLTLELIKRVTNQRQEILKTFKDIIFVAGGHLQTLAIRGVQKNISVLLILTTPNIRGQNITNNSIWIVMRKGEQNLPNFKMGVVQQLASLTMSMMKNFANPSPMMASQFYSSTDLYPFFDIFKNQNELQSDGSYLIINQKDENLQLNQNLIKSQDHHLLIIDFIKIMEEPTTDYLPMRALHAAYNFLTVLVWNNSQNKKQLENILYISECHLKYNVGCIDFFKTMYANNKKLVKKSDIKPIIEQVIGYANDLDISKYLKSKLLDFLRIAVIFDNKGYDINQNIVMELISQYQVSSNNQIVYLKAETDNISSLSGAINDKFPMWIEDYQVQYKKATFQECSLQVNISAELFYVSTFFQIFSALIQNENVVNIGKASNMHPIDFLYKILQQSKHCWIIIRHLRAYLNKLYYFDGRSKDSTLLQQFIYTDLPIIKDELKGIVELICNFPEYHTITILNPIRYKYLGSYIFLSLQQILHSLDLFFKEKKNDKLFQDYLTLALSQLHSQQQDSQHQKYDLTFNIIQIIEMLEYLLKTIDGRYINKYVSRVSKRLRNFVMNAPFRVVNLYNERSKFQTNKNIDQNKINSDDIPLRKSYLFHDGKGFWRHLVDWNSFKDQEIQREKDLNKVQKRVDPIPNETKEAGQQRKRDFLLDLIFLGNIDKRIQKAKAKSKERGLGMNNQQKQDGKLQSLLPKNLTTSTSVRFKVKKERFSTFEQKNIIINDRRKKLVKFLQINEQFHKFSQEQIDEHLYNIFSTLNTLSKSNYNNIEIVGNEQVIKSIVKMNDLNSESIHSQYKLLIIKLLTNFIQRESNIFQDNIQKWYITKSEDLQKIQKPQNFLYECGVAAFLSSLIINDLKYSLQMANAILMLGISLLLGKNKLNQGELFKLIQDDQKNLLLNQINNLVKECGALIASHNLSGEFKEYNPDSINYSDTFDFYIDTEKVMTRKFIYQPETVLEQKEFDQKVVNMQYAFIFLKNLCEGNTSIKDYIRDQLTPDEQKKIKSQSINFLTLSVTQLKEMFANFNIDIIKVSFSIIDFIYEVTQIPCLENQLFICKSSWFADFAFLEQQISDKIEQKVLASKEENILIIFSLYSSNIKNVISCLEGNIPEIFQSLSTEILCKYFVRVLAFYIKFLPIVERVAQITAIEHLQVLLNRKKLHESYYLDMFQITSVIVKLQKKTPVKQFSSRINFNLKRNNLAQFFELLKNNLLGIQIKMEGSAESGGEYQTLFFPKHKILRYLSRSTRNAIMQSVDRSTQRDKIIGLFNTKQLIIEEIQHNYILDNEYTLFKVPFSITNAKIDYYNNLGLKIAALICALMLYFAAVVFFPHQHEIQYDLGPQKLLLSGLSIVQFIISLMYLFLWSKTHMHLSIQKYQRQKAEAQEAGQIVQTKLVSLLFKVPGIKKLYCLKQDDQFGNMLLFMFGSTMGIFYKIEWFSVLLMNLLMAHLDVLKNILKALKASLNMLGMLSFFGASFICFFSVFSLYYYVESIYPDKFPKNACESVFGCIIELYIKEQIGNDMQLFQVGRFTYDMVYIVFMDMLFGNIVGGVLIDNFASLRLERQEMLKDKTEKCFICGIDKESLQKKSLDLKTHYIQQYHKLWNYVFYLYYLQQQTKKTGLEQIIQKKYREEDVSWIPSATSQQNDIGQMLSRLQKYIKVQEESILAIEYKQ